MNTISQMLWWDISAFKFITTWLQKYSFKATPVIFPVWLFPFAPSRAQNLESANPEHASEVFGKSVSRSQGCSPSRDVIWRNPERETLLSDEQEPHTEAMLWKSIVSLSSYLHFILWITFRFAIKRCAPTLFSACQYKGQNHIIGRVVQRGNRQP